MKRTNMNIAITGVLMLLLSGSMLAQRNDEPDRDGRKAAVKELRERYREWARAEIVPKLTAWKNMLDTSMAPEDLSVLNDLRAEAKELRTTIRRSVVGLRKAWRDEDYEALKEHRAQLNEARRRQLDILDLLTPLAIEYRETLKRIGAAAKPIVRTWGSEAKEIWETWKREHDVDAGTETEHRLRGKMFLGGVLDPKMKKAMRVIRFMLWDGETEIGEGSDAVEPDLQ